MQMRYKTVIAAGFVGAVAMAAAAFGQTGTPSGSPSDAPAAKEGRMKMRHAVVHSETKLQKDDGFVTRIVDTGTVTAVDGNTLTIKRADDESVTVTAGEDTKVRRNGEAASVSDVQAGDRAHIVQLVEDGTTRVVAIRAASPDFVPERTMGKHRMRGKMGRPPIEAPADAPAGVPADDAAFFAA